MTAYQVAEEAMICEAMADPGPYFVERQAAGKLSPHIADTVIDRYKRMVTDLETRLIQASNRYVVDQMKLTKRIEGLEAELARKTARIAELEARVN